jgi:hypothetical protein
MALLRSEERVPARGPGKALPLAGIAGALERAEGRAKPSPRVVDGWQHQRQF